MIIIYMIWGSVRTVLKKYKIIIPYMNTTTFAGMDSVRLEVQKNTKKTM